MRFSSRTVILPKSYIRTLRATQSVQIILTQAGTRFNLTFSCATSVVPLFISLPFRYRFVPTLSNYVDIIIMASVAGLTLNEAILPLKEMFTPKDLTTTKVENNWTTAGGNEHYYKMYLPVCGDPSNKEVLLYVIEQFYDAAHNDRLHWPRVYWT